MSTLRGAIRDSRGVLETMQDASSVRCERIFFSRGSRVNHEIIVCCHSVCSANKSFGEKPCTCIYWALKS